MTALDENRVSRELDWTEDLSHGAVAPDVLRMQEWLALHGFSTTLDGLFGPATGAQLVRFQRMVGLEEDATRASVETLRTLSAPLRRAHSFRPTQNELHEAVLQVAARHLACRPREVGGRNHGPWVRSFCGYQGEKCEWCAGFSTSVVTQAAAALEQPSPVAPTRSCDELGNAARDAGRLTGEIGRVRGGDIFLSRRGNTGWFHSGIVTTLSEDHFDAIEVNSSEDGFPNGYEVTVRTRGFTGKDFVLIGADH